MGYSVQQIKTALGNLHLTNFPQELDHLWQEDTQEILKCIRKGGIFSILNSNGEFNTHPLKNNIRLLFESFPEWCEDRNHLKILYMNEQPLSNSVRNNLQKNETTLFQTEETFLRDHWGTVITDMGLHEYYYCDGLFTLNDEDNTEGYCYYRYANHVVYNDDRLHFYGKNGEEIGSVGHLGGINGRRLARVLTQICQLPENTSIYDLLSKDDFEGAKQSALVELWCNPDSGEGHFEKGEVLFRELATKKGQDDNLNDNDVLCLNEAKKEYEKAIELFDEKDEDDRYFKSESLINLAIIDFKLDKFEQSRNYLIQGLDGYEGDDKEELFDRINDIEEELKEKWENFSKEVSYKDRKFIMPIKDSNLAGCVSKDIYVFRQSNIPSCIRFPIGHPVANQLYIGHPFNSTFYVPYEESEELFFLDKVHELRYLLECLGAEEISITSIKGKEVSELSDESLGISGSVGIKKFSAEAEYNTQSKGQYDTSSHNQRTMTVKLDPMQRPFLPNGLIWYNEMPQWQRLVQSRLKGNLLEYSEFVSTDETKFTSSSEMTDIKASAKFLWAKANAEVNECLEKQFKESTETQWKVDVKFRSIKDFDDSEAMEVETIVAEDEMVNALSEYEQNYAEELKFCLEDGNVIDEAERRLLKRKRVKWGISEERAAEIERFIQQSSLTEDEQEYLDAVKDELVDGNIPEASRRLLDRLRKRMDISDERAKEIEIMVMKR